jgi:hypothetical protein
MKYSKLRTKDRHIISSKWISKDKTINRNNYSVAVSIFLLLFYITTKLILIYSIFID